MWESVKGLAVLGKDASHIASSLQMVLPSMALGICTSLFTCGGNNGIAKASAITIACLTEKKKEQNLVKGPLNIMANGPCDAYMAYRFPTLSAKNYSG